MTFNEDTCAVPLGTIYGTPDAMLKAVHDIGFVEERGELQDHHCRYCDAWLDKAGAHEPEPHAECCLFFQIEDYLKEVGRLAGPPK